MDCAERPDDEDGVENSNVEQVDRKSQNEDLATPGAEPAAPENVDAGEEAGETPENSSILLSAVVHRAWARYERAFSDARRGPSEHSIHELRSAVHGLLAVLDALKGAGAIDGSFGLRGKLKEQMEIARGLREVQLRLHGAEALISEFPQLDSFREAQFNAQTKAVQDTLRALGKVKFSAIERRYTLIENRLEGGELGSDWRGKVLRKLDKRFSDLSRAVEKLHQNEAATGDSFRLAFHKYHDLFLALDGFALTAGQEARLAFRFADASLNALDETGAVLSGLATVEKIETANYGTVVAELRALETRRLRDLAENSARLLQYPPNSQMTLSDPVDEKQEAGRRELYVLRHAEAVSGDTPGFEDDRDRMLTPQGIRLTKKAAAGLRALGIGFDRILTSPLIRARQTADIVAVGTRFGGDIVETEALTPGADPRSLFELLNEEFETAARVLVVGHQPELASLVSILTTGDLSFSLNFKKGAICKIAIPQEVAVAAGSFEWMLTSKLLAQVD